MKDTALILIDVQNDYFPGGKGELKEPEEAARVASEFLARFRKEERPVIHIQHATPKGMRPFILVEGSEGAEIHHLVRPNAMEPVISKRFPNAFHKTELDEQLKALGVKNLIICGMMTHMCVSATSRRGFELGYRLTVIEDACATRALQLGEEIIPAELIHKSNLAAIHGSIANVISSDQFKFPIPQ